jgi:hypothetical protein
MMAIDTQRVYGVAVATLAWDKSAAIGRPSQNAQREELLLIGSIRLCLVTLSIGLAAIATPAAASTITYSWSGMVTEIFPGEHPTVSLGQRITASLTLNDGVSDFDSSPEVGRYLVDTALSPQVLMLAVDIAGYTDIGMFQEATVLNDHNGRDAFSVSSFSPHLGQFEFNFITSDLGVLTSDALPLSLDPHAFQTANFTVSHNNPLFSGTFFPTPLPGSIGLLVSALTGLIGAGWWKSHAGDKRWPVKALLGMDRRASTGPKRRVFGAQRPQVSGD